MGSIIGRGDNDAMSGRVTGSGIDGVAGGAGAGVGGGAIGAGANGCVTGVGSEASDGVAGAGYLRLMRLIILVPSSY